VRALRNKNRDLHFGHFTSRIREASLFVSVIAPTELLRDNQSTSQFDRITRKADAAAAFIKENRINLTGPKSAHPSQGRVLAKPSVGFERLNMFASFQSGGPLTTVNVKGGHSHTLGHPRRRFRLHPIQGFEAVLKLVDLFNRAIRPFGFYLPMLAIF
jgi:hypothetical protein